MLIRMCVLALVFALFPLSGMAQTANPANAGRRAAEAVALLEQGNLAGAAVAFDAAFHLNPRELSYLHNAAAAWEGAGNLSEAIARFLRYQSEAQLSTTERSALHERIQALLLRAHQTGLSLPQTQTPAVTPLEPAAPAVTVPPPAVTPPPAPPAPAPAQPRARRRSFPWASTVLYTIGGAALVFGVYSGVDAIVSAGHAEG
ncbi:MAG: hypothetical protein WCV84_04790, partial [Patescibacteria group bacterium]